MGNMSKTFKVKLAGLGGVVLALVITSGCMGGGGGKGSAQEYAQQAAQSACSSIARVCNDGSAAVKKDAETCVQTCPEDKEILEKIGDAVTGTGTSTATGTGTSTTTQTTCSAETYACSDGSVVGRDPSNGCQFKACPSR